MKVLIPEKQIGQSAVVEWTEGLLDEYEQKEGIRNRVEMFLKQKPITHCF
jgi:hypothetical protein